MSTKTWDERITTRYTEPEKDVYEKVIELVKKNSIPKSTAQLLLVKRGLEHTQNPEPLVKEKVVYKDKIVYRDRPKADEQRQGLSIQEHIGGSDTGQLHSGDTLKTRDKADPPHTALEEEKSPSDKTRETQIWGGWLPLGVAGILGLTYWLIKSLPGSLPPR